jgi:hypothetical protein
MPKADVFNRRIDHLVTTLAAKKARSELHNTLCNDAELREMGLITIRFSELEESLALYCELLLIRPEVGGFLHQKAVLLQPFTEKVEQYMKLSVALGTMYSIDIGSVEESMSSAKLVAEETSQYHPWVFAIEDGTAWRRISEQGEADSGDH